MCCTSRESMIAVVRRSHLLTRYLQRVCVAFLVLCSNSIPFEVAENESMHGLKGPVAAKHM